MVSWLGWLVWQDRQTGSLEWRMKSWKKDALLGKEGPFQSSPAQFGPLKHVSSIFNLRKHGGARNVSLFVCSKLKSNWNEVVTKFSFFQWSERDNSRIKLHAQDFSIFYSPIGISLSFQLFWLTYIFLGGKESSCNCIWIGWGIGKSF